MLCEHGDVNLNPHENATEQKAFVCACCGDQFESPADWSQKREAAMLRNNVQRPENNTLRVIPLATRLLAFLDQEEDEELVRLAAFDVAAIAINARRRKTAYSERLQLKQQVAAKLEEMVRG